MPEAASRSESSRVAPVGRFAKRNRPESRRASVAVTSMESSRSRAWVRLQPSAWASSRTLGRASAASASLSSVRWPRSRAWRSSGWWCVHRRVFLFFAAVS